MQFLFGPMPLKRNPNKTWIEIWPLSQSASVFPLQGWASKINQQSSSCLFLNLNLTHSEPKYHGGLMDREFTGHILCVGSWARHWGSGLSSCKQNPESLPSQSSALFWKLPYLKEHIFDEKTISIIQLWLRLEKRPRHFGDMKNPPVNINSWFFIPALKNVCS